MTPLELLKLVFKSQPPAVVAVGFFAAGLVVGRMLFCWAVRLTDDREMQTAAAGEGFAAWCHLPLIGPMLSPRRCRYRGVRLLGWGTAVELLTATLFAAFVFAKLEFHCQRIPEVRPYEISQYLRILYHLCLLALLIAATCTDFRDYVIPDSITITGIVIGVASAGLSGDLQIVHFWVDWNHEIPGQRGPLIPEWIKNHHHLHGLAWSLAGMAAGGAAVWLVRGIASLILGREAMGFGDVTLMAMIGSFIGWQPVLIVLALSPFCGLLMAAAARLISGRTFIPFGPFLSLGAVVVLFGWRWIWMLQLGAGTRHELSVRKLFGDWPSILILVGIALAALVLLLGLLRLYRRLPGKVREM